MAFSRSITTHASTPGSLIAAGSSRAMRSLRIAGHGLGPSNHAGIAAASAARGWGRVACPACGADAPGGATGDRLEHPGAPAVRPADGRVRALDGAEPLRREPAAGAP